MDGREPEGRGHPLVGLDPLLQLIDGVRREQSGDKIPSAFPERPRRLPCRRVALDKAAGRIFLSPL